MLLNVVLERRQKRRAMEMERVMEGLHGAWRRGRERDVDVDEVEVARSLVRYHTLRMYSTIHRSGSP